MYKRQAPNRPIILKPINRTTFVEGENITFAASVYDPDTIHVGQVLTISWSSNHTGVFKELSTDYDLEFVKNDLPVGYHRILVSVSDGEFTRSAWLELTINEEYIPPSDDDDDGSFFTQPAGLALILVIILVIVGVMVFVVRNRRENSHEDKISTHDSVAEPVTVELTGHPLLEQSGGLSEGMGAIAVPTQWEGPTAQRRESEWELADSTPPPYIAVNKAYTTVDLEEQAHTKEVREVMKALTQLPQGLPNKLMGWDLSDLARAIVDGEKSTTPDGAEVVKIDQWWFTSNHVQIGTFLQEWSTDASTTSDLNDVERERKLKQLEDLLLEGDISEETYERLRAKYEGP